MADAERTFVYEGPLVALPALGREIESGEEITGPPALGYIQGMRPKDVSDDAIELAAQTGIDLTADPKLSSVKDVQKAIDARTAERNPGAEPEVPEGVKTSKAALQKAAELGVDIAQVEGTGSGGAIKVTDVEDAAAKAQAEQAEAEKTVSKAMAETAQAASANGDTGSDS